MHFDNDGEIGREVIELELIKESDVVDGAELNLMGSRGRQYNVAVFN